jgi:hypothetical protein
MSLINDALKKAQKQQNPQAADAAAVTGTGASTVAPAGLRRGKSMGLERWLLGIVALVVVLVGLTVVGVLVFRKEGPPQIAAAPRPIASPPVAPIVPAAPAASVPAPAAPSPAGSAPPAAPMASAPTVAAAVPHAASTTAAPMTAAPAIAAAPAVATASPPPAAPSSPAVESPAIAAPTVTIAPAVAVATPTVSTPSPAPASSSVQVNLSASAPAPEPTPPPRAAPPQAKPVPPAASPEMPYHRRVLAFVDSLHVTGVRAAGDDSKVLMNDRVYHLNDMVNIELGVRLTGVSTTVLLFADENNKVYTKALQ